MSQSKKIDISKKELLGQIGREDRLDLLKENADFITSANENISSVFIAARHANSIEVLVALVTYANDQQFSADKAITMKDAVERAERLFIDKESDTIFNILASFYQVQGSLPDELLNKIPENQDYDSSHIAGGGNLWSGAEVIEVQ